MNTGRASCLLKWINTVSGTSVLSIKDFSKLENVKVLMKVLHLIDKDSGDEIHENNNFTVEALLSFLISYLGGFYHQRLEGIVSADLIAVDADEVEIGKLITLLLCGAVQCDNVDQFIQGILTLDDEVQFHIKAIIETVLQQVENGGLDAISIANLLKQPVNTKELQHVQMDSFVLSPAVTKSPVEKLFSSSPFMSLMSSPQMKSKQKQFSVNKLHEKVKKLQLSLDTQNHVQSTLEADLAEQNKEMDAKDGKIRELKKELIYMRNVVDELEIIQHYKADFEKADGDNERLKQRVIELEDFKEQSSNLEERMATFLGQKAVFNKQVEEREQLKTRCECYTTQVYHLELHVSEQKAALNRRDSEIARLEKQRDEAMNAASEAAQLWKGRKISEPETDEEDMEDNTSPVDLKPPNLESRTYEARYVEAKCEILELEDSIAQKQAQARIREEDFQRKIEDGEKSLESTKETLEYARKDLSRVQSELSVARGEIEAHVIATEKQRAASSKALHDVVAEKKVALQEAGNKYSELRREMEANERKAEVQLDETRKKCQTRTRHVTDELQSILQSERDEYHQKLDDAAKQIESQRCEFNSCEEELKKQVSKIEIERDQVRNVYEEMLANVRHELENEIQSREKVEAAFQEATAAWYSKEVELNESKTQLVLEITELRGKESQLMEDTARLNEEVTALVENEKQMVKARDSMQKDLSSLKEHEDQLNEEKSIMSTEKEALKENMEKVTQEKAHLEEVIAALKDNEAVMLAERAEIGLEVASLKGAFASELRSVTESLEHRHEESLSRAKQESEDTKQKLEAASAALKDKEAVLLAERAEIALEVASLKGAFASELRSITESLEHQHEESLSRAKQESEDTKQKLEAASAALKDKEAVLLAERAEIALEVASLKGAFASELRSITESLEHQHEESLSRAKQESEDTKQKLEAASAALKDKEAVLLAERAEIALEVASLKGAFASELRSITESLEHQHEESLFRANQENEDTKQKLEAASAELAKREQNIDEFTQTCGRLKKEIDATERMLLGVTQERNTLEEELLFERQVGKENVERLSFQMEQLKAEHAKAVQEMMSTLQEERKNHKMQAKELKDELGHACQGLKVAADNIEELKRASKQTEQQLVQEKAKVRNMEDDLEKVNEEANIRQKGIFEEASEKHALLEEAYESDRAFWKNKLEAAKEEVTTLRSTMLENKQQRSAEMMEVRRQNQEKNEWMEKQEKVLREEIQGITETLTNAEASIRDFEEKIKVTEAKEKELEGVVEKSKELEATCAEFIAKEKENQLKIEKTQKDFEVEIEKIKDELKNVVEEKAIEVETTRKEVEGLKKKIGEVEEEKKTEGAKAKEKAKEIESKVASEIEDLKVKLEQTAEPLKELENSLQAVKGERDEIKKGFEKSKKQWEEKEIELQSKVSEFEEQCNEMKESQQLLQRVQEEINTMEEHINALEEDKSSLEERLAEEHVINRRLGTVVNSLEAQGQHADRILREQKKKLQEYQNQSENMKKTKKLLIEVEKVLPVEKAQEFLDGSSTTESDDSEMQADDLGMSRRNSTVSFASTNSGSEFSKSISSLSGISRSSMRSTTSLHGRTAASRRQSAVYLKGSTPPYRRTTSENNEFAQNMESEAEYDFDWERLEELERRNTICPPHLKTSYPVETQTRPSLPSNNITSLRRSHSETLTGFMTRKRKSEEAAPTRAKQPKEFASSKSESHLKRSKSKRFTNMVSSTFSSLRSRSSENLNNKNFDSEKQKGGSVAFSIDVTPSKGKPVVRSISTRSFGESSTASLNASSMDKSMRRESFAYTINNSPPQKKPGTVKVQRRRTINRSTASTQLIQEKHKESFRREKKQESLNKRPLRQTNAK